MEFSIRLETYIERHPDEGDEEHVASVTKYYDVKSLDDLQKVVAHFGKAVVVLIEGEKLGDAS